MTEKIIDPWLSDINRTIGDMVTELEAEKDLRASYERQCLNLEIQQELRSESGKQQLSLPINSKFSKSRLLCIPSHWTTGKSKDDEGSLNLALEIDLLKTKIEQLENVNKELASKHFYMVSIKLNTRLR